VSVDALGRLDSLLVLGGGSQIAEAITAALIARGTRRVLLAGRTPESLAPVAERLRATGAEDVEAVVWDARDTAGHGDWVARLWKRHGDIDCVLHAAAVLGSPERDGLEPEAARALLETNLVGAVTTLSAVAERLGAQGRGRLIVLSSVAAERPRRANYLYGASKAGLDAWAQGLADDLAGSGVEVTVVRPGFVPTQMTAHLEAAPLATTPDRVAACTLAGLDRGAHTVWAPPALRWVMAVLRHLPRPLFRRLSG
jgi:decaprenylphospho-beta-D-erythro-pentofuranosid-2-ulose 2-reductase